MKKFHWLAAAAICLIPTSGSAQMPAAKSAGEVAFVNSGAAEAQQAFHRGLALLHNFEYPRAIAAFQEAQAADPGFAMAYWGEAMAHTHPVWMQQDADKARAALAKLAPTAAARQAKAATARERALLDSVETLYGEGSKEDRDRAFSLKMEALHRAYPQDVDIASFYALSLLGLAHDGRDVPLYMRAAAVLEPFFPRYSRHPGVLHYLIHSYDDPTHAPLGLRAARLYGAVAPDAAHALHMTSHIFLALGDWKEVIAANQAATTAVNEQRQAAGKPPGMCGHYLEWDYYAQLQLGRTSEADLIRRGCHAAAVNELAKGKPEGPSVVRSYADMLVRGIVETGRRPADPALKLTVESHPRESFILAYADLLSAGSDRAALASAHQRLRSAASRIDGSLYAAEQKKVAIMLGQAKALEALRGGRTDAGLRDLLAAAEIERTMPAEFGPPLVEKPSFELLGEEYLRLGRSADAAKAFRSALALAPGRRLSQSGLVLAEKGRPGSVKTAAAAPHKH
jgi:tetratricopeptide (TPR) repeat protein